MTARGPLPAGGLDQLSGHRTHQPLAAAGGRADQKKDPGAESGFVGFCRWGALGTVLVLLKVIFIFGFS